MFSETVTASLLHGKDIFIADTPDEFVDAVALIGPKERIIERLQVWKSAGEKGQIGSMLIGAGQTEVLELIANEIL